MESLHWVVGLFLCLYTTFLCGASLMTAKFKATDITTTWIASDAQLVGQLSKIRCAQKCTAADNNCFAFHMTAGGKCYLVKENKNWMEQRPMQDVTLWIKQGAPDTACKAPLFPQSFGRSRYFYEKTNTKNWTDAAAFCESKGGKLTQISTDAERQFLWNIINSPSPISGRVLIGGYKDPDDGLLHEQGWKWRGSEEAFDASLWNNGLPDNWNNNQFCAAFRPNATLLDDVDCHSARRFICECWTL